MENTRERDKGGMQSEKGIKWERMRESLAGGVLFDTDTCFGIP